MMPLYSKFLTSIRVDGVEYDIRPSWDRVLEAYDTRADKTLPYSVIVKHVCALLFWNPPKDAARAAVEVFRFLEGEREQNESSNEPRCFDFRQDAKYIYGAFWQTYGIRLAEWRDTRTKPSEKTQWMHWHEFLYLFASLPEDTRISWIMGIRSADIPARNEHNGDTVDRMIRQKAAFRLDISEDDGAERFAKGAKALFDKLEAQARNERKKR